MTTATEAGTVQTCPAWCAYCTSEAEGGYGHFGEDRKVGLTLMAPSTGVDILHRHTFFSPAELRVCLDLPHGAALPTIRLSTGEGADEETKLSLGETMELIEILGDLLNQGTAAVFAAATPKH